MYRFHRRSGFHNCIDDSIEALDNFTIVQPHAHNGFDFGFDKIEQRPVVVAFVLATHDPNGGFGHGLQGVIHRIDVGRFAVVDVFHTIYSSYFFESVGSIHEGVQTFLDYSGRNAQLKRGLHSKQCVHVIVLPHQWSCTHFKCKPANFKASPLRHAGGNGYRISLGGVLL